MIRPSPAGSAGIFADPSLVLNSCAESSSPSGHLSAIDRALRFSNFLFGRERLGEILDGEMPEHVRALLRNRADLVLIEVTDAENAGARNGHASTKKDSAKAYIARGYCRRTLAKAPILRGAPER